MFAWRFSNPRICRNDTAGLGNVTWATAMTSACAQLIRDFVARKKDVSADDLNEWHSEFEFLSEAGRYFFSANRYIFKASKPAAHAC